jgi:hypothetical protein
MVSRASEDGIAAEAAQARRAMRPWVPQETNAAVLALAVQQPA